MCQRVSRTLLGFALIALSTGCPSPDPAAGLATLTAPDQFLDYNEFVCSVQPVLIRRCSYPACHGNADHALRIYSAGKLRLGATDTRNQRDGSITADEIERNFESASGIVYPASLSDRQLPNLDTVQLLAKPLTSRFGGGEHHGIGIFPVPPATTLSADPEWNALVAWVGGKTQPNPVSPDCAAFFMQMGITPRSP